MMPIYTNIPEFPCHHPQRHRMLRSSIGIGPRGSGLYLCKDVLVVTQSNRYTIPRSALAMPHESSVYDPVLGDTILFRTDSGDVLRIGVIVSVEPNGGDITFEAYGEITTSGYSPTISVSEIEGGHRLTIHDVLSTRTVDIMDGVDGVTGEKGDPFEFDDFTQEQLDDLRQEVASVYCRKLESTYQTSGTTSRIPIPFNVSEFDMLLVDIEGLSLTENVDYHVDGNDIVLEVPITHDDTKVNTKLLSFVTLNVSDLADLASMVVSPTLDVSDIEGGHRVTINDVAGTTVFNIMDGLPGPEGATGPQGDQGEQGEKGDRGDPGAGMIAGGNAGQVFAKASDDDYDAEWTSHIVSASDNITSDIIPSSHTFGDGCLDFHDSNGDVIGSLVPYFVNNGNQYVVLQSVRDVDGSDLHHWVGVGIDPNGSPLVSVGGVGVGGDAARQAWRTAIGAASVSDLAPIGTVLEDDIDTAVSVPASAWKTIGSLVISHGIWVVTYRAIFATNVNGNRYITLSSARDASGNATERRLGEHASVATTGAATFLASSRIYRNTGSADANLYLNVWQGSSGALNVTGNIRAIRIK